MADHLANCHLESKHERENDIGRRRPKQGCLFYLITFANVFGTIF